MIPFLLFVGGLWLLIGGAMHDNETTQVGGVVLLVGYLVIMEVRHGRRR